MNKPCVWKHKFSFIGAGNMASAFIYGFINNGVLKPEDIVIYEKDADKCNAFLAKGVHVCTDYNDTFSTSQYIFLAVKPNQVKDVLTQLRDSGADFSRSVFISICAAVPCDYICSCLGTDVPVVRLMPSTPITVGLGTVAVSHNSLVSKKDFELLCRYFSRVAVVSVIPEELHPPIIAVNGSSPAFFYLFVKAMLDSAEEQGVPRESALPLILRTMEGSAEMIRRSDCEITDLIKAVSSPGGTTLAALDVFYKNNFEKIISDAMKACTNRAEEITESLCSEN